MANDKASDFIEEALNKVIQTAEDYDDGDILVDWAVICYVTNPDKEKGSGYPMYFSNGDIPMYRARGLFTTGLFYLNQAQEEVE